ncbi:ribonuclease HII [Oceanobacillus piezotolerans]|uniref:Ribonuclease HII n=1 Tax=Oceanobacillus piezotolerans TaxID=2448030 RepID=A0A498DBA0_9BACI|nr:ribonuclease HII [Oceanobacillus piezotolerans]RLL45300.1 ribonuclease HII [Oceanobacillus piezotolerans]
MEKQSIKTIKTLFQNREITDEQLEELKQDSRKGVQQIIGSYEKQLEKEKALEANYIEMCQYELTAYKQGYKWIAGIDEAGRGPLAGPVVAAAVILPEKFKLLGLNDSKQLNEGTREAYFSIIKKEAISYGIGIVDNSMIDKMNIFEATKLAMRKALEQLNPMPDYVLIDAVQLGNLTCPSESIVKGDAKSISIAAASVLAKVTRDHLMKEIHKEYPLYDFASNMGYGTKNHLEALENCGITPYHRKSFAPVRNAMKA